MAESNSQIYRLNNCQGPVDGGDRDQRTPVDDVVLRTDQFLEITPDCPALDTDMGRCGLTGNQAHCIFIALNRTPDAGEISHASDKSYLQKLPRIDDSPQKAPLLSPVIKAPALPN